MAKILVVDDEEGIRNMIGLVLRPRGHEVREAGNGQIAMDQLAAEVADLVLMDLIMPDKEGLETITEVRRSFPTVRIIAISGGVLRGEFDFLAIAQKMGADRTLRKPFGARELLAVVEEVLSSPARSDPNAPPEIV